ncbi:MAG: dihydrodipicolinate synthase family protein [Phycisphaerae bacterium]|jgi:hypothetical protein|nr:dihydrodipicolinate synthase family protein [Phycisphaerae bacterium]
MSVSQDILTRLKEGQVIPANPLALTCDLKLDEVHQRALARYYLACGVGGLAVGVHTTQFKIHDPEVGLYQPVLELAMSVVQEKTREVPPILIAGICGKTGQAIKEAQLAKRLGYHFGMVSPTAFRTDPEEELIEHHRRISEIIPVMGFYLQPAGGGRFLSETYWRKLLEIPNLVGIKVAAFNRYQTLDVLRALAESGRADEVALYTGNDDSIVMDLLTPFQIRMSTGRMQPLSFVGGLLGHWSCWTKKAVELLEKIKAVRNQPILPVEMLTLAAQVTESNEALFDPVHHFCGANPGVMYALKQAGLVRGIYMLDDHEKLAPEQPEKIDRIRRDYPHMVDDDFVRNHLADWLRP